MDKNVTGLTFCPLLAVWPVTYTSCLSLHICQLEMGDDRGGLWD